MKKLIYYIHIIAVSLLLVSCKGSGGGSSHEPFEIYPAPSSYDYTAHPGNDVSIPFVYPSGSSASLININTTCVSVNLNDNIVEVVHGGNDGDACTASFTMVVTKDEVVQEFEYSYSINILNAAYSVAWLTEPENGINQSGYMELAGSDIEVLSFAVSNACSNNIELKDGKLWIDALVSETCNPTFILNTRKNAEYQTVTLAKNYSVAPFIVLTVNPADKSFDLYTNNKLTIGGDTGWTLSAPPAVSCPGVEATVSGNTLEFKNNVNMASSEVICADATVSFVAEKTGYSNTLFSHDFNITRRRPAFSAPAVENIKYQLPGSTHTFNYDIIPANSTLDSDGQYTNASAIITTDADAYAFNDTLKQVSVTNSNVADNDIKAVRYNLSVSYNGNTYTEPVQTVINYEYDAGNNFSFAGNTISGMAANATLGFAQPNIRADRVTLIDSNSCAGNLQAEIDSDAVKLSIPPNSAPVNNCTVNLEVVATNTSALGKTNKKILPVTVSTQPMLDFGVSTNEFDIYTYYKLGVTSAVNGITLTPSLSGCSDLELSDDGDAVGFKFDISKLQATCNAAILTVTGSKSGYTNTTKTFTIKINKKNIRFDPSATVRTKSITYKLGEERSHDIEYTLVPALNHAAFNGEKPAHVVTVINDGGLAATSSATDAGGKVTAVHSGVLGIDSKNVKFKVDLSYNGNTITQSYDKTINYVDDSNFNFDFKADHKNISLADESILELNEAGIRIDNLGAISNACTGVSVDKISDAGGDKIKLAVANGAAPINSCAIIIPVTASKTTTRTRSLTVNVKLAPYIEFEPVSADTEFDIYTLHELSFTDSVGGIAFDTAAGKLKIENCPDISVSSTGSTDNKVSLHFDISKSAGTACTNGKLTVTAKKAGYSDTQKAVNVQITKHNLSISQPDTSAFINSYFKIGESKSHDLTYDVSLASTDPLLNGGAYVPEITVISSAPDTASSIDAQNTKITATSSSINMNGSDERTVKYKVGLTYNGKTLNSDEFTSVIKYIYDDSYHFSFDTDTIEIVTTKDIGLTGGKKAYAVQITDKSCGGTGFDNLTASIVSNKVRLKIADGSLAVSSPCEVKMRVISSDVTTNQEELSISYTTTKPQLVYKIVEPLSFDLSGHKDLSFDNTGLTYVVNSFTADSGSDCSDVGALISGNALKFYMKPVTGDMSNAKCEGVLSVTASNTANPTHYTDTTKPFDIKITKQDYTVTGNVAGQDPAAGNDKTVNNLSYEIALPDRDKELVFKASPYGALSYISVNDAGLVITPQTVGDELRVKIEHPGADLHNEVKNVQFKVKLTEHGLDKEFTYNVNLRYRFNRSLPFDFAEKDVRVVAADSSNVPYDKDKNYIHIKLDDDLDGDNNPETSLHYPAIKATGIKLLHDSCNADIINTELKAAVDNGEIKLWVNNGAKPHNTRASAPYDKPCELTYRVTANKYIDQSRDLKIKVDIAPFLADFKQAHDKPYIEDEHIAVFMEVGDTASEISDQIELKNVSKSAGTPDGCASKLAISVEDGKPRLKFVADPSFTPGDSCTVKVDFDAVRQGYTNTHKTFDYTFTRTDLPTLYAYWHRNTEHHTVFRTFVDESGLYIPGYTQTNTPLELQKSIPGNLYHIANLSLKGCSTGSDRPEDCSSSPSSDLVAAGVLTATTSAPDSNGENLKISIKLNEGADFTGNWVEISFDVYSSPADTPINPSSPPGTPNRVTLMKYLSVQTGEINLLDLYRGGRPISLTNEADIKVINKHASNKDRYYVLYTKSSDVPLELTSPWTPIQDFTGILDGRGRTIKGLGIDSSGTGLFDTVTGGHIRWLNIEAAPSSGVGSGAGIIAKKLDGVTMDHVNVVLTGDITGSSGTSNVGAIAGEVVDSNISRVSVRGNYEVKADGNVGVLFGKVSNTMIERSFTTSDVSAVNNNAGNIAGLADNTVIKNVYTNGSVQAADKAGGIVGEMLNGGNISNAYVTGSVKGGAGSAYIAGIAGKSGSTIIEENIVMSKSLSGGTVYRISGNSAALNRNYALDNIIITENSLVVQPPESLRELNKEHGRDFNIHNTQKLFNDASLDYKTGVSTIKEYQNSTGIVIKNWITEKTNGGYLLPILGSVVDTIQPQRMPAHLSETAFVHPPQGVYYDTVIVDDIETPVELAFQHELFANSEITFKYADGTSANNDNEIIVSGVTAKLEYDVGAGTHLNDVTVTFSYTAVEPETKTIPYKISVDGKDYNYTMVIEYIPLQILPMPADGDNFLEYTIPVLETDTITNLDIALGSNPESAVISKVNGDSAVILTGRVLEINNIAVSADGSPAEYFFTLRVSCGEKTRDLEYKLRVNFAKFSIEPDINSPHFLVLPQRTLSVPYTVKKDGSPYAAELSISSISTAPHTDTMVYLGGNEVKISVPAAQDNETRNVGYDLSVVIDGEKLTKSFSDTVTFTEIKITAPQTGRNSYIANKGVPLNVSHTVIPSLAALSINVEDSGGASVSSSSGNLTITADSDALIRYTLSAQWQGITKTFDFIADVKVKKELTLKPSSGIYTFVTDPANAVHFPVYADASDPVTLTITPDALSDPAATLALSSGAVRITANDSPSDGDTKTVIFDITATSGGETLTNSYTLNISYDSTAAGMTIPAGPYTLDDSVLISTAESVSHVSLDTSACSADNGIEAKVESRDIRLFVNPGSTPAACAVKLSVAANDGTHNVSAHADVTVTTEPKLVFNPVDASVEIYKDESVVMDFNYNTVTGVTLINSSSDCAGIDISVESGDKLRLENTGAAGSCNAMISVTASKAGYTDTTSSFPVTINKRDQLLFESWGTDALRLSLLKNNAGKTFITNTLVLENPLGSQFALLGWDEADANDPAFDISLSGNILTVRALKDHAGSLDMMIKAVNGGNEKIYRLSSNLYIENGSASKPYTINSFEHFKKITGHDDNRDKHYELTGNIDMLYEGWTASEFYGKIDGKGFAVNGIKLADGADDQGLFSKIENGAISNLVLTGENSGKNFGSNIGLLAGTLKNSTVNNVTAKFGRFNGVNNIGGIAGSVINSTVNGSAAYGAIYGDDNLGGIAGQISGGSIATSYSSVVIEGNIVGGIAGRSSGGTALSLYSGGRLHGVVSGGIIGKGTTVVNKALVLHKTIGSYSVNQTDVGSVSAGSAAPVQSYALSNTTLRHSTYIGGMGLIAQNRSEITDIAEASLDGAFYNSIGFMSGSFRIDGGRAYTSTDYLSAYAYEFAGSGMLEMFGGVVYLPQATAANSVKIHFSADSSYAYKVNGAAVSPSVPYTVKTADLAGNFIELEVEVDTGTDIYKYTEYIAIERAAGTLMNPELIVGRAELAGIDCMAVSALANDIVLNVWTSLCSGSSGGFSGIFDGNGFQLANMSLNNAASDNQGLFRSMGIASAVNNLNPEIKNLAVSADISGANNVGVLAGAVYNAKIVNVSTSGSVNAAESAGGIVGYSLNSAVMYSRSSADVTSSSDSAGGITGKMNGGIIHNSYATGSISALNKAGGIAGDMVSNSTLAGVYSTGSVNAVLSGAGGIAGWADATSRVENSVALNSVISAASGANRVAGGTAGVFVNNYALNSLLISGSLNDINGQDIPGTVQDLFTASGSWSNVLYPHILWRNEVWDFSGSEPELK